jgi:hypothetical protein
MGMPHSGQHIGIKTDDMGITGFRNGPEGVEK